MNEVYWAKQVGKTPIELDTKRKKVEEIAPKVIRGFKLSRAADTRYVPENVERGNLPKNIFDIYSENR